MQTCFNVGDVFSTAKRSEVMSLIRGKGNKDTEGMLRRLLREQGIAGWRRHLPLPGKPDFAFPRQKIAIFVDGCFWHGCPKCYTRPKTNRKFWDNKREDNMARDRRVARQLRASGWKVLRIWEHALKKSPQACIARIRRKIRECP